MKLSRPTWVEIDLDAIRDNVRKLSAHVGGKVRLLAVVKANAYGHGAVPAARACVEGGAHELGVASVEEGIELRESGITTPILIVGATLPEESEAAAAAELSITVASCAVAESVRRAARRIGYPVSVHMKVDTGMGRVGVSPSEAVGLFEHLAVADNVKVVGVYTHFSRADEADPAHTLTQLERFHGVIRDLRQLEWRGVAHAANSAALLTLPQTHLDMVRAGITLFGAYPAASLAGRLALRPAATFKSRIVHLKEVEAGEALGYGTSYRTARRTRIATIPAGYADGYLRSMSNRGRVLVRGVPCPVAGLVCMDQFLAEVGVVPEAQLGDEVILWGQDDRGNQLSLEEVSQIADTIPNEFLCALSKRVPRVYV